MKVHQGFCTVTFRILGFLMKFAQGEQDLSCRCIPNPHLGVMMGEGTVCTSSERSCLQLLLLIRMGTTAEQLMEEEAL